MKILENIKNCGIVPVVVLDKLEDAKPLAEAFLENEINIMEITFRTSIAKDIIALLSKDYPNMIIGAGTVLTLEQLEDAVNSGAKFIVSPGFDLKIVKKAKELNIPVFPGAVTPSEIIQAINAGLNIIKFFPSENYGGLKTIKSLSAPFKDITFIPTGGINEKNLKEYISFDKIVAVGGSWICPSNLIKQGDFKEISKLCKEAKEIINSVRNW